MEYLTNCIASTVELLEPMIEQAQEIEYDELLSHVSQEELNNVFPFYIGIEDVLTLENDYAVSYYKSFFDGQKCVYVEHSAIEYIFINK
ncbi:MAG: hypothetical protein QM499_01185 [Flavobacteriaceae bacterium]